MAATEAAHRYTPEENRERVHKLWTRGLTDREIASETGLSKSTVTRIRNKLKLRPRRHMTWDQMQAAKYEYYKDIVCQNDWPSLYGREMDSDERIIRSYRNAADPANHYVALAELNQCQPLGIGLILFRHGVIDRDELRRVVKLNREWCNRRAIDSLPDPW